MMDFYVITSRGSELIAQVIDGQLVIVPAPIQSTETDISASVEASSAAAAGTE